MKKLLLAVALAPFALGFSFANAETSVTTDPVGFHKATLAQGTSLMGVSLVNPAHFAGQAGSIAADGVVVSVPVGTTIDFGAALTAGTSYYLEVTSPNSVAGHRFEVDTAATRANTANKVVVTTGSNLNTAALSALNGTDAKFVVRPHVTLGQLVTEWGTANLRAGDQIVTFVNGAFVIYNWNTGASQWRVGLTNRNADTVPPGRGFYFRRSEAATTDAVFTGEVRNNHFVQPLAAGNQIVAQGFPVPASFAFAKTVGDAVIPQRNLLNGTVSQPSTVTLTQGDRVTTFANGNFTIHTFNAGANQWRIGLTNVTNNEVFTPTGAVFIELAQPQPNYTYLNPVQN
jgi:hypothetical protein